MGLGCLTSAASLVFGFWRGSSAQALDGAQSPLAVLLFIWAVGLYGYASLSAADSPLDRFSAGSLGSLYVVTLIDEAIGQAKRPFTGQFSSGYDN
jgi:hypothetical protein